MNDVSQRVLQVRNVGENIASISQDIGLLLRTQESDEISTITKVKHAKSLVDNILSVLALLSSMDMKTLDRREELSNEVRKIQFSCVGLQSLMSQSLINIELFKIHKMKISNFLQTIVMAANRIITISFVTKYQANTLENIDSDMGRETNCCGDDNNVENFDENKYEQNECNNKYTSGDNINHLYNVGDVCYKNKESCEQDCEGICLQDKYDGSYSQRYPEFSETPTKSADIHVENGYYKQKHDNEHVAISNIGYINKNDIDEGSNHVNVESPMNFVREEDKIDDVDEVGIGNEKIPVKGTIPEEDSVLYVFNEQNLISNKQASVEDEISRYNFFRNYFGEMNSNDYENNNEVVNLNILKENNENKSEWVDSSITDCNTQLNYESSNEGCNKIELSELLNNESQKVPGQSGEIDSDLHLSSDLNENCDVTTEGSDVTTVYEDMITTEISVTESIENTVETSTSLDHGSYTSYDTTTENYEITTENIESTTSSYYDSTTEVTTPAYETTTQDLYKVSQDIYSAAQDLSTKANEISSITSDISSKISSINSMVSDLNTYDDDELSKKIQSVSKITQDISSKTSEISSLCSTTSSLASDISSASSDMPSADRYHRFKTSPWQKMSTKCQDMVTACQSIVTAAQDILLNVDNIVTHTDNLKVADAVSTGVYDVTARIQLVISETLNIVSAVIELMNVIES